MKALRELQDKAYSTIAKRGIYAKPEYSIEKSRMNLVISILKRYVAEAILDVGCGEGIYIIKMRPFYKLLIGLDFCRAALLDIKKETGKAENIECILADAHKLPIKNDSIDLVISSEVLEHTENPSKVFDQISDVSKRYVMITVPIEMSKNARTVVDLTCFDPQALKHRLQSIVEKTKTSHIHQFSFHSFEKMLRKNEDLEVVERRGSAFTFVGSGTMRKLISKWKPLELCWKLIEIKLLSRMLIFRTKYRILGNEFGVFVLKRNSSKAKSRR